MPTQGTLIVRKGIFHLCASTFLNVAGSKLTMESQHAPKLLLAEQMFSTSRKLEIKTQGWADLQFRFPESVEESAHYSISRQSHKDQEKSTSGKPNQEVGQRA